MRRSPTYAAVALAAGLGMAGCGGGSSKSASPASRISAPTTVNIASYAYQPSAATVKAGTKLTFVNHDATAHTATATGALGFDTGSIKPNGRATVTLTKPGTYSYICQFHPFMKATIIVR